MRYTAEHIATDLARKIVTNQIAPNAAMPPIRQIAETYDVNVTTAQRTVDRLVATGLVQKRGRKQLCAVDFSRESTIDTVALVLGFAEQMPLLARDYFDAFVAVTR